MTRGPQLYRIGQPFDGRLAVSRMPRGFEELEDEVAGWRDAGIDMVVSMLEVEEAEDVGLAREGELCRAYGIEFVNCSVQDHGIPGDHRPVVDAVERAIALLGKGKQIAAHCFAGIGRSPLFVACCLVHHGLEVDLAWARINAARGLRLPDTEAQRRWVADFAQQRRAGRERR